MTYQHTVKAVIIGDLTFLALPFKNVHPDQGFTVFPILKGNPLPQYR
ncbi:MAG: hypothetical protein WDZ72_04410 [Cyclobacteriaceae bacterium]